ncbi:MAG: 50S ribosomal protein L25 [Nitrospinales bacterium]
MSLDLKGKIREKIGKGASRQARREGQLVAVLYGKKDNLSFVLDPKQLNKIFREKGINAMIDLSLEGDSVKNRKVILKDYQAHPTRQAWVHADFFEVDMAQKITVSIPVKLVGACPGVKQGGVVNHIIRTLEVECLPGDIPELVEVSLAELELGQVIHVKDISFSDNLLIKNKPEETIVTVYEEKEEVKPVEEEAAVAEGVVEGEAPKPEAGAEEKPAKEEKTS